MGDTGSLVRLTLTFHGDNYRADSARFVRGCDAPAFKFAPNIIGSEIETGCGYVSNDVYGVLPPVGVGVYGDIYQSLIA
jgi:hypothetical protein